MADVKKEELIRETMQEQQGRLRIEQEQREVRKRAEREAQDRRHQEAMARWQERKSEPSYTAEQLRSMPGRTIELQNTEANLHQIALVLHFGETAGIQREQLKDYGAIQVSDRTYGDEHLVFDRATLVFPSDEDGETYEFCRGMKQAYCETIQIEKTGRQYNVYLLERELDDGDFWVEYRNGIRLEVEKCGSMWEMRINPPSEVNGVVWHDFVGWLRSLRGVNESRQSVAGTQKRRLGYGSLGNLED